MAEPINEQRKAVEAYVQGTLSPLIEQVLTKQLSMAAVFLRDELTGPRLAGGKLEPVHPNHRPDLRYVLETLQMVRPVLKNAPLREQVEAAINGMAYIIKRTEEAARGATTCAGSCCDCGKGCATSGVKGGSDGQAR
jgi:hypothetical protein